MSSNIIKIALITEGDFEDVTHVDTEAEAKGFCDGFSWGGNCYGAGSCYAVPEHELPEFGKYSWYEDMIPEIKKAFKDYKPE